VLTDASWAVSYLTDGSNDKIAAVVNAGMCPFLVRLLSHQNQQVCTPALRAVGNIVTGDETQTQAILDCAPPAVARLRAFLDSSRRGVRKEACWVASNIAAGTGLQIQALIDAAVFPAMIKLMSTGEFEIKREICWAISNAVSGGTPQQINYLVKCGCFKPLCEILQSSEAKVVLVALEAIENILRSGHEVSSKAGQPNPYTTTLEEADGLDVLDDLQNHPNKDIYERAVRIMEQHYGAEEENENTTNTNFGSSSSTGAPFNFGTNNTQFSF